MKTKADLIAIIEDLKAEVDGVPEEVDGINLVPVETTYTIGKQSKSRGSRKELLVSNYSVGEL